MGRSTKCNRTRIAQVRQFLADGLFAKQAAVLSGISEKTYYDWLDRAEREPDSIFAEFREAVEEGTALGIQKALGVIQQAAMGWDQVRVEEVRDKKGQLTGTRKVTTEFKDWKAAEWWLSKRDPEAFGDRRQVDLTGEVAEKVYIVEGMPDVFNEGMPTAGTTLQPSSDPVPPMLSGRGVNFG